MTISQYNRLLIFNQVSTLKRVCFLTNIKYERSRFMGSPRPTYTMRMTSCNARVRENKRVNKEAGFYKKRTACLLIPKYATRLKVPDRFNLRIDTIGCAQAIIAYLAIKRSTSVGG